MKLKRYFGKTVLIASLVMAFSMSVNAKTLSLGKNAGKWTGGISNKQIYSKITDTRRDGLRLHGTVYVKNDLGKTFKKTSCTRGVTNSFSIKKSATYKNIFEPNRAGYSGFYTTKVKGE